MLSAVSRLLPPALDADWHHPLLFSWTIDEAVLQPLVPDGLELDRWEDRTLVSLVGLRFERVRLFGIPAPQGSYAEINLRFYVRRKAGYGDPHPGVVFIRQLVPHRATAFVARVFYGEPFAAEATGNQFDFDPSDEERSDWPSRIAYRWGAPGRQKQFWGESSHEPRNPPVGSLEEFLTRRYWGYNGKPGRRTKAYHLTRPDWLVQTARDWGILGDVGEGCDPRIVEAMRETPVSVLFAAGSRSSVSLPERLPV